MLNLKTKIENFFSQFNNLGSVPEGEILEECLKDELLTDATLQINLVDSGVRVVLPDGTKFSSSFPLINIGSSLYIINKEGLLEATKEYYGSDAMLDFSIFDEKTVVMWKRQLLLVAQSLSVVFLKNGRPLFRSLFSKAGLEEIAEGEFLPIQTFFFQQGEICPDTGNAIGI